MSIEENVIARQYADVAMAFVLTVGSEGVDLSPDGKRKYFEALRHALDGLLGIEKTAPTKPATAAKGWTDQQALKWSKETTMPFGKYAGERICDVPADYLEFLDGLPDFRQDLGRYLATEHYQRHHFSE